MSSKTKIPKSINAKLKSLESPVKDGVHIPTQEYQVEVSRVVICEAARKKLREFSSDFDSFGSIQPHPTEQRMVMMDMTDLAKMFKAMDVHLLIEKEVRKDVKGTISRLEQALRRLDKFEQMMEDTD